MCEKEVEMSMRKLVASLAVLAFATSAQAQVGPSGNTGTPAADNTVHVLNCNRAGTLCAEAGGTANPLPVNVVSGGGSGGGNAAAGTNGSTAPTSSSSTGYTNAGGNQTAVSPSTPLPVAQTGALPAGTNAVGSITNTAFGISGTLPAYAATPTFNIGTAPVLTATGSAADAATATNPQVSACIYKSAPTTYTAGQQASNLCDVNGRQIVVGPQTAGSALVGGGLRIMGSDGSLARDLRTATDGTLYVANFTAANLLVTTVPLNVTTTVGNTTTSATANTFTNILGASTTRRECVIYSSAAYSIALGTSPTAANAIPQAAGTIFRCSSAGGSVAGDQINIASATASAPVVVWSN